MAYTIPIAVQWDDLLRTENALKWMPDWGHQASPPAIDGTRQFRSTTGGGLWRAQLSLIRLSAKRANILKWLETEILLKGGMIPVDIPLLLCRFQPRPATPVSDDAPVIEAVGGWAARAVSGRIDLVNSSELVAGMHFAVYDAAIYGWRLHRLAAVSLAASGGSGDGGPTERDIEFWPPARFAVDDGDRLEFKDPRVVMRLAAGDSMDLELEQRKRGNPSAEFVEAF